MHNYTHSHIHSHTHTHTHTHTHSHIHTHTHTYTHTYTQGIVFGILSCFILQKMMRSPKTITLANIGKVPYENRFVRSLIDACAFRVYGHWVKRGEEQNRAALFETVPFKLSSSTSNSFNDSFSFSPAGSMFIV